MLRPLFHPVRLSGGLHASQSMTVESEVMGWRRLPNASGDKYRALDCDGCMSIVQVGRCNHQGYLLPVSIDMLVHTPLKTARGSNSRGYYTAPVCSFLVVQGKSLVSRHRHALVGVQKDFGSIQFHSPSGSAWYQR